MATRYAQNTEVSADKSRNEIEATLRRYGADQFLYGWDEGRAVIGFRAKGRQVKFVLPLPDRKAKKFTHYMRGRSEVARTPAQAAAAWEQSRRQAWRALALVIKAKLEAVEAEIVSFESEFLAHMVLPNGQTVGNWIAPQLAVAYERGDMPKMLPAPE